MPEKLSLLLKIAVLCGVARVAAAALPPSTVVTYPVPPCYVQRVSHSLSVSIDGRPAPVLERVGVKGQVQYAQCSVGGAALVTINAQEPIQSVHICPEAAVSGVKTEGTELEFSLKGPAYLVIQINRLNLFCLIADPLETDIPNPADRDVVDVAKCGIDPSGRSIVTGKLQYEIDALSAAGGGTLYFGPGAYRAGTIKLKSGVSIYLAGGAVLLGSGRSSDFPTTGTQVRKGSKRTSAAFVRALGAHDIRLYGRGSIDLEAVNESKDYLTTLNIIDCQRVRVEGIMESNSHGWTVIGFCQDVTLTNFKSLQDVRHATDDACDIVNCRRVAASHCLLVGGDDGFCVKTCDTAGGMASTWGYREGEGGSQPASDISLRDSVIYSNAAALKIGIQGFADISRVTLENLDIARTRRLAIDHIQGAGRFGDIEFRNIRVDEVASSMRYSGHPQPLSFTIAPAANGGVAPAGGAVGRVLLQDVSFANWGEANSSISGAADGWSFGDIRIQNLRIAGQLITSTSDGRIDVGPGAGEITFVPASGAGNSK